MSAPTPRPWFVPIVETLAAARDIETIARLERIDLIYVGVCDLSALLGCPGRMDSPELAAFVDRILTACRQTGKPVGMMALSADAARLPPALATLVIRKPADVAVAIAHRVDFWLRGFRW